MAILPGAHAAAFNHFAPTLTTPAVTSQASGSNFYVAGFSSNPAAAASPVTDSFGNVYSPIGVTVGFNGGFKHAYLFGCENGVGGAGHTFTYTLTTGGTLELFAVEVTGALLSGAVDNFSGLNVTGAPYNGTPVSATNVNELLLVFAGSQCSAGGIITDNNGAGILDSITDGANAFPGFSGWRAAPTTGVYNSQLNPANPLDGVVWNLLLKPLVSAPATPSYPLSSNDYF